MLVGIKMKTIIKIPIKDLPLEIKETFLRLNSAFERLNRKDRKRVEGRCNAVLGRAVLTTVGDFFKELGYTYDTAGIEGVWETLGGNDD